MGPLPCPGHPAQQHPPACLCLIKRLGLGTWQEILPGEVLAAGLTPKISRLQRLGPELRPPGPQTSTARATVNTGPLSPNLQASNLKGEAERQLVLWLPTKSESFPSERQEARARLGRRSASKQGQEGMAGSHEGSQQP